MIPCYLIDEHRDAFYIWNLMMEKGEIPENGSYLLHIDHHDDMECGGYEWDLNNMPADSKTALEFTDKCLGIADFIAPALWQGIFGTLHIVKNLIPSPVKSQEMIMCITGDSRLTPKPYYPFLHRSIKEQGSPSARFYTYRQNGLSEDPFLSSAEHVVLDIDLDFFCWDNSLKSAPLKKIEITRQAYEEYCSDRNHPFRILPKLLVKAREIDGRYYMVYEEHASRDTLPSEERISRRIDRLISWLEATGVVPDAIDVCRSSLSGYLPAERAEYTEQALMNKLGELYQIDIIAAYE